LFTKVVLEEPKYNTDRFVLQEFGILLGGCLTAGAIWGSILEEMGTKVAQVWNLTKSKTAVIHW
jgi:hypothetical protein